MVLSVFEAWVVDLQDLARRFRDILFPVIGGVTHFSEGLSVYNYILDLLREHVERLQ